MAYGKPIKEFNKTEKGMTLEGYFVGTPSDAATLRDVFKRSLKHGRHKIYHRTDLVETWIGLLSSEDRQLAVEFLETHRAIKKSGNKC